MRDHALTPSITVTIGHQTRVYFAFVTTAPVTLDAPSTLTLHTSTFADASGFAADPIAFDAQRGQVPARLVLVDAMELAWQRAQVRGHHHVLLPTDPGLLSYHTLQHWLWQRLQSALWQVAS